MSTEIVKLNPTEYGLEESKAAEIAAQFKPMLDKMVELEKEYNDIIQLPIDNPITSKKAKELRLKYVKVRTGTAEIHKNQKAFYLAGGRFVDGWKNAQVFASQGIEEKLEAIEKHFENLEKQRVQKLHEERSGLLMAFEVDSTHMKLGEMSEDVWKNYIAGVELQFNAKKEAERKAEEERLERERKDRVYRDRLNEMSEYKSFLKEGEGITPDSTDEECSVLLHQLFQRKADHEAEQERIRIENDRLKKEAEERDAKIKDRNTRLSPYITYIRDYNKVLEMSDEDFEQEVKNLNKAAMDQMKFEAEQRIIQEEKDAENIKKLAQLRAERERVEAELQAKKDKEAKAEQGRIAAEQAKLSMGDKQKMDELTTEMFSLATKYTFKSEKYKGAYKVIQAKLKELIDQNS